ncbi:Uu.00g014410.m01.CDS01 [Anthostomella pinea]|uniref:Uu.00g014410.m01.CDS01 n=1 Tax=Anthostomella pinea TaxID=933095 RepID=A0AAI8YN32_9PEZI|nr:Uu.00g014410.m01.CDS01 [Anthostomella pinea]
MPIRNPFAKRPGALEVNDENIRPGLLSPKDASAGFERVDTVGSRASSAWSIRSGRSQDNGDYKMSVVNDSGVYLPPSPIEEKGLWPRQPAAVSRTSTDTRSSIGDIEHFSISRESFDSYRRSFDISARSPVLVHDIPRQSLDSARFPRIPRTSVRDRSFDREPPTEEEGFEDVGLNDEQKQNQQQPKKRGFFAKFSDSQELSNPAQGMSRFIPGRKRAQSGGGAELSPMERPKSAVILEGEEMQ